MLIQNICFGAIQVSAVKKGMLVKHSNSEGLGSMQVLKAEKPSKDKVTMTLGFIPEDSNEIGAVGTVTRGADEMLEWDLVGWTKK